MPGFRKKSFVLPFAGGEIWFEHLDGIYEHEALVIEKLKKDIPQFSKPSMTSNIGFVLNETTVTAPIIEEICDALLHHGKRFMRVGFIGTDRKTSHTLKNELYGHGFSLGFFSDFEKAKEWLVKEFQ